MTSPLVSVITPTWERSLEACHRTFSELTYPRREHVIVTDGPNELWDVVNLGHHRPEFFGSLAVATAVLLSRGEYIYYALPDDDLLMPESIATLVGALETAGADFAYSKVAMIMDNQPMVVTPATPLCGTPKPQYGGITNFLFRRELVPLMLPILVTPEKDLLHPQHDWDIVEAFLNAGKSWVFVPEVLHIHHVDH